MTSRTRPQTPTAMIASELEAFLGDLRDRRGLATNTIASYRYDLRTAALVLTEPLVDITAHQVEAFLVSRQDRPSTTNRRIASLSRFFTWAIKHELCDRSPMLHVDAKQDDIRLPHPIPLDNLPALDAVIAKAAVQLNVGDVVLEPSREALRIRKARWCFASAPRHGPIGSHTSSRYEKLLLYGPPRRRRCRAW